MSNASSVDVALFFAAEATMARLTRENGPNAFGVWRDARFAPGISGDYDWHQAGRDLADLIEEADG